MSAATSSTRRERAAHIGPRRRRPQLLDVAFELFLEHGYEGTSVESIARAAGVTKPVVYSCFDSKEQLFRELLRREEQKMLDEVASALPSTSSGRPEEVYADALTAFLRAVEASPGSYRLIFLGGMNTAVARRVQRGREVFAERIARMIEVRLGETVEDRDIKAALFAEIAIGTAEAAARALLTNPERWSADALGQMIARLLVRGESAL